MKEADEFAYVVSHDLQAPLRNIINFVELIEKHLSIQKEGDKELHYFLNVLNESALHMDMLIRELLDYSRSGREINIEKTDSNRLVAEVLAELKPVIYANQAQIETGKLPVIDADPVLFKQLMTELICNAIKFRKKEQGPVIKITGKEIAGQWSFSVSDNGIGIAEPYWEKIFVVFKRLHAKEAYRGTGMGLAICKKIVVIHGGEICVNSVPGQGTTVYFTWPKTKIKNQ